MCVTNTVDIWRWA